MLSLTRSSTWIAAAIVFLLASPVLAQPVGGEDAPGFDMMTELVQPIVLSVVFTLIGLLLFGACLWLIVKIAPFSVRKEIEEDQNVALGIIVGAMILGIAIILAAALLG